MRLKYISLVFIYLANDTSSDLAIVCGLLQRAFNILFVIQWYALISAVLVSHNNSSAEYVRNFG